jgi:hypothetical protein
MDLPDFSLVDYDRLLSGLLAAGYELNPVEELPRPREDRVAFLRHDVDVHIPGIERIAAIERRYEVSATYYVPLTLHFNPFYPENRDILRHLVSSGHRIGLHYDLRTYPPNEQAALEHLDNEVDSLSELVGSQVESICMHYPWEGHKDIFRLGNRYIHPHHPRYADQLTYVSDSCRVWRDATLLSCFGDAPPRRLLLNTHPELWLGERGVGRHQFARTTLIDNVVRQHRAYVIDQMLSAWAAHPTSELPGIRETQPSAN